MSGQEVVLFDAVRGGDERLVEELLKRGAPVRRANREGVTPLMAAASTGRNELARLLLDHGAAVNAYSRSGHTALMRAAMRGNLALAQLLVARGADKALVDTHGKTAAGGIHGRGGWGGEARWREVELVRDMRTTGSKNPGISEFRLVVRSSTTAPLQSRLGMGATSFFMEFRGLATLINRLASPD